MESLNMNILANSLPNSGLANAEADLTNNFKAAALSLTTLYKSSRKTSKRAYNAGYSAACHDLLLMIQQGVSAGESSEGGSGMTVGRIMDYIEARLEAIRSQEEEEDEDEERDKERLKASAAPVRQVNAPKVPLPQAVAALRSKDQQQPFSAPMTPRTPGNMPAAPTSPSPFRPSSAPILPSSNLQRAMKSKLSAAIAPQKEISIFSPTPSTSLNPEPSADREMTIANPVALYPPISAADIALPDISTGMKRPRHAAMMFDVASGVSPGTARRRTRSHRGNGGMQDQNQSQINEEMDVEEEGRERKRVARR